VATEVGPKAKRAPKTKRILNELEVELEGKIEGKMEGKMEGKK